MAHDFKRSGFIRAGFQYQDLVAIASLIDFYRDRTRFEWITVESEDPAVAAIDDVVACRADGLFELTQVKFAIDPANEQSRLDWPWLLRKKKRGTSMTAKVVQYYVAPSERCNACNSATQDRPYTQR